MSFVCLFKPHLLCIPYVLTLNRAASLFKNLSSYYFSSYTFPAIVTRYTPMIPFQDYFVFPIILFPIYQLPNSSFPISIYPFQLIILLSYVYSSQITPFQLFGTFKSFLHSNSCRIDGRIFVIIQLYKISRKLIFIILIHSSLSFLYVSSYSHKIYLFIYCYYHYFFISFFYQFLLSCYDIISIKVIRMLSNR